MTPYEMAEVAVRALDGRRAKEIRLLKTTDVTSLADYFGVSIDYLACGEKASVISVDGLTDEQVDLVTELARSLQQQNKNHRVTPKSTPTPEQQELVFKVIEQFLK